MREMTRMSEGRSYSEGLLPHHCRTRSLRRDGPTIPVSAVANKVFKVHAAPSVYTRLASSLSLPRILALRVRQTKPELHSQPRSAHRRA